MAELRAFLLLTLGHILLTSGSALDVYAPPSRKAELGTNVMIPCTFKWGSSPINRQHLTIMWEFQGSVIVIYDNKGLETRTTKYIDQENIKEGAADLYIQEASVSDIGTYRCTVISKTESRHKEIDLILYARPSISALEKMTEDDEQDRIVCSVTGFYPQQITLEMMDGAVMRDSVLSSPHKNNDETFSMNSSLILPASEKPKSLSCRVHHESLAAPIQRDIRLVYNEGDGGDLVLLMVGVIVGSFLIIVLLVIGAVLYRKKSVL